MECLTRDRFLDGQVMLHQPRSGYRFSVDAVILSHLACPEHGDTVLDLGTGCGVIPILLAYRHPSIQVVGVEIQDALVACAIQNVKENQMAQRIQILAKDMVQLSLNDIGAPVDVVVSNPPYRKLNSGRINADTQRAVARHELKINLDLLLSTARRMLRKAGRLVIIYPCVRAVDLISAMRSTGLEPKSLTMIHSNAGSPAQLVAVTGIKGGRPGLEVSCPLHLYNDDGTYTATVEKMFNP
jgi:tRNA1Val (adenine37-N6)-methyltransferase